MKPNPVEVGRRIKSIRLEKGMTQEEFGKKFNNAQKSLVSHWEKGVAVPNASRIYPIARFGGITVDELLYGDSKNYEKMWTDARAVITGKLSAEPENSEASDYYKSFLKLMDRMDFIETKSKGG